MTHDAPPAPPTPASHQRTLDRALVRGVAWTGAFRWGTQLLSWTITIALARILSPSDYGLFGLALLYISFVQLINEFGLGAAIIRRRDLSDEVIAALGGVSIALGFALWGVSAALAPLLGAYFDAPELRWPLVALSAVFVTTSLRVLPKSLLARDLRFKAVAAVDAIDALIGGIATLVLALLGFRYWSLVLGSLIGGLVGTITALAWRRHRIGWPRTFAEIRPAVSFGSHIMLTRLCWYLYTNADFATVGKLLGKTLLGAYTYGWTLASIPVDRISGLVAQVTPGIFSAVQDDPAALKRYLLKVTEGLALLTFPLAIGLATVADLFVVVVLGDRWWAAIGPLAILGFYASWRSITTPFPHILQAVGQSARAMWYNLFGLAVLLPMFVVGSRWGVDGVALAWLVGYPIVSAPMLYSVMQVTGLTGAEYVDAIRAPLHAAVAMAAAVIAARSVMPETWAPALQLALAVTTGAVVYGGVMLGLHGERLRTLRALARELRR